MRLPILLVLSCAALSACRTVSTADPTPAPNYEYSAPSSSPHAPAATTAAVRRNQDSAAAADDEWRFSITPYAWILGIDGNIEVGGTTARIDEDFSDIVDQLNFVIEGRFEAWKGRWGTMVDLTYSRLENDVEAGPIDAEVRIDMALAVAGGLYRFVDAEPAPDGSGGVQVDGFFGVGWTALDTELDFAVLPDRDGDKDWFDPLVGLRAQWHFTEDWSGFIESLVGGFELFDGSELFTMFTTAVGRKVGGGRMILGWRSLEIDYDQGSSSVAADLSITGPIVGFNWAF